MPRLRRNSQATPFVPRCHQDVIVAGILEIRTPFFWCGVFENFSRGFCVQETYRRNKKATGSLFVSPTDTQGFFDLQIKLDGKQPVINQMSRRFPGSQQ
ncbi:MAG: hypothetical protein CMJ65_11230 [Planctomycetaceae bacterium]|nr:hypothetical protein [Planctomycetaceae bacterium]